MNIKVLKEIAREDFEQWNIENELTDISIDELISLYINSIHFDLLNTIADYRTDFIEVLNLDKNINDIQLVVILENEIEKDLYNYNFEF